MKRGLVWASALALAWSAAAQEAPPPDVPAGDATLEGRVVDAERGGVAELGVILYSLLPNGDPGLRQARTDAEGRFRFEGVSGDPEVVYLVGTRVGGVPFGARTAFEAGETLRRVEIEVAEPSREAAGVRRGATQLRLERGCSHLRVHHQQALTNPGSRVVFIPPDARDGARPLFELELPEQATAIETPMGTASDGFERDGRRVRFFGPVYPGDSSVDFSYGIPLASASSLRIGFPDGAEGARILVPAQGTRVRGEGVREQGEVALPGVGPLRSLQAPAVAAGQALQLEVAVEDAGGDAVVEVGEARLWLELDDAAMDVSELYQLRVEDAEAAEAASAPLLCIPLPAGAESLRFSNASLAMGLSRDPEGALAVTGPVPAGESSLSLRYRLPATPGTVRFEREFQSPVDLLTVLVADTGLVPHAERLHRRRPIRTEDRSYLHLEGFGIEPGERIELALDPLPQRQGLPPLATSGAVLLVAVAALFYLIAPLRAESRPEASDESDPAAARLSREREAVYAAIEDLDDDLATGKLSTEDHEGMRAELRARAVVLLQAERAPREAPAAKASTAPFCHHCGTRAESGDRFCSQCGTALRLRESEPGSAAS